MCWSDLGQEVVQLLLLGQVEAMLWAKRDRDHFAKEFKQLVRLTFNHGISGILFAFFEAAEDEVDATGRNSNAWCVMG